MTIPAAKEPSPTVLPPQPTALHPQRTSYRLYTALFVTGFLLRFVFMLVHKTYVIMASAIYETSSIAEHLVRGDGFSSPFVIDTGPSAWIAPVYPYLISLVFRIFGTYSALSIAVIFTAQCLLAAGTAIAIFELGKRTIGERIALWAAWIWTVCPFFFRWPVSWVWDMTFSALALTVALILTFDLAESGSIRLWLRLGAWWAIIALTNPALLSVMPFTVLYAAIANLRAHRAWFRGPAFCSLIFLAIISPWLVRNYVVFRQPIFLRSNYWFEFHLGNYHFSNGIGFSGKHPTHNAFEMAKYESLGEIRYVQQAKEDAIRFVREHPLEFLNLALLRTHSFWDGSFLTLQSNRIDRTFWFWDPAFLPKQGEWWKPWEYCILSVAGLLGLLFALTRRPRGWLLFAAPIFIYPFPYYLAFPTARYRHAIEPLLLLLSVYLVSLIWMELQPKLHPERKTTPS